MKLQGKKVTIVGMGISGWGAARLAASAGAHVTCTDIRPLAAWPGEVRRGCEDHGFEVEAGAHPTAACRACDLVVASPGVPPSNPALLAASEAGVPVIGELAMACAFWTGPIVGITGTNGKTTTTKLLDTFLQAGGVPHVTAGNIGTPLSACLDQNRPGTVAVLEVSSFQLDQFPRMPVMDCQPPAFKAALWLNLSSDHFDRYPGLQAYGESKAAILDLQNAGAWAVLNANDTPMRPWKDRGAATRLFFGRLEEGAAGAHIDEERRAIELRWPGEPAEVYSLEGWRLKGSHNLQNLAAAIVGARLAGASPEAIRCVIPTFTAPPHRLQWIARLDDVDYYDDSKATNVASVLTALSAMDRPVVLLAGGRGKGEDYSPLAGGPENGRLKAAVLIGEEAEPIAKVLTRIPTATVRNGADGRATMRAAVEKAADFAEAGDAVLLAPACASFDMFQNYQDRGRAFQDAVREKRPA